MVVLILALFIPGAMAADPGHGPEAIGPGTFEGGGDYIFPYGSRVGISNAAGDSFTYIWNNGTAGQNKLLITHNASNVFVIDNLGRVGIGTSEPQYAIDVVGAVNANQFCINGDCKSTWSSIGGGGFYNNTPGTYTGSLSFSGLTGYRAGNAICDDSFPGSHMCYQSEIIRTIYASNISEIDEWAGTAWINSGGPKYAPASTPVNDCNGWTHGSTSYLGSFWIFDQTTGGRGAAINCGSTKPLACCA